jgi:hypothetical protein
MKGSSGLKSSFGFSAMVGLAVLTGSTALADERTAVQQPEGTGYDNPRAGVGPRGDHPPALADPGTVEEGAETIEDEALENASEQTKAAKQETEQSTGCEGKTSPQG